MKLLIFMGLITSISPLFAKTISFDEAVDMAAANNNQLSAQKDYLESSRYLKKAATSSFMPSLSAQLGYDYQESEKQGLSKTTSDGYDAALSLRLNLFNGFSDYQNYQQADIKVATQEETLKETKASVSYELKNALANYFYAKDSVTISKEIVHRRKENLDMVQLRFESGRENKGSVMLSEAYLQNAQLDLLKAENNYQISLTSVRKVLNLSDDFEFEITKSQNKISQPKSKPNFDELIKDIPLVKRYELNVKSAQSTVASSRSAFYPTWDLQASLGRSEDRFFPNDNKNLSIGTTISWNLFNGGKDFYTVNSNALLKQAAQKELQNQFLDLKNQMSQNYSTLIESNQALIVSKSFLDASKVRAEINRSKYNNGLQTFDEWDRIENEHISYQRDYLVKERDQISAEASWEKVLGQGVIK